MTRSKKFAALVGLLIIAVVAVSSAHADELDLTTVGAWGTINGANFQQFSDGAAGSGNIDAFVRIQRTGVEQGYNTDYRGTGFPEFEVISRSYQTTGRIIANSFLTSIKTR